jgi:hypothetical protein
MITANSIMKRFRYVSMTNDDALVGDLEICLAGFQDVLLATFTSHWSLVMQLSSAPPCDETAVVLKNALATLRLMARVFFSLNWAELPE